MKVKHVAGTRIHICIDNADLGISKPGKSMSMGTLLDPVLPEDNVVLAVADNLAGQKSIALWLPLKAVCFS